MAVFHKTAQEHHAYRMWMGWFLAISSIASNNVTHVTFCDSKVVLERTSFDRVTSDICAFLISTHQCVWWTFY